MKGSTMQEKHAKHNSQVQRIDPWADIAHEFSASAQEHRALCNRLGQRFQEAQQEAQAAWATWDEAMGAEDNEIEMLEEEVTGTNITDMEVARQKRENSVLKIEGYSRRKINIIFVLLHLKNGPSYRKKICRKNSPSNQLVH
jgi:hypothetical protein